MPKVLSVQVPAPCPLQCAFCRTPDHGSGDAEAVLRAVNANISDCEEIYLTSNGETGLSPIFSDIVRLAQDRGIGVAVLCATERSVVEGLRRVEISLNQYTQPLALRALEKARRLGIPIVISIVDDGEKNFDLAQIASEHAADGVLIRALQSEGRSKASGGTTRIYQRPGSNLGLFPSRAYAELEGIGHETTCINHNGEQVSLLGNAA